MLYFSASFHSRQLNHSTLLYELAFALSVCHQKKSVDGNVEIKRGEHVAGVAVVPNKDLDRNHQRGVEQQRTAEKKNRCEQSQYNTAQ